MPPATWARGVTVSPAARKDGAACAVLSVKRFGDYELLDCQIPKTAPIGSWMIA